MADFVIKARGLPWSATAKELSNFFTDVNILNGEEGIHFTFNKEGRPSGEAFIEVSCQEEKDKAIAHNNEHMGKRYIEVKEGARQEMDWAINKQGGAGNDGVLRLRGLPFGCSKQDVADFFTGLSVVPYGITITMDQDGRATGDAYVEFSTPDESEKGLLKHKEKIGHRYIEIFKSAKADIKNVVGGEGGGFGSRATGLGGMMGMGRPGPYDRPGQRGGFRGGRGGMMGGRGGMGGGGGDMSNTAGARNTVQNSTTGHSLHMRGLPFEATLQDVLDFFSPLIPVDVRLCYEESGRPKGQCDVDFQSHTDAVAGMNKDKGNMGHRYIELFLRSSETGATGGWGRGGGNMNRGGGMQGGMGGMGGGYGGGYGMMGQGMGGMGGGMNQGYSNFQQAQMQGGMGGGYGGMGGGMGAGGYGY